MMTMINLNLLEKLYRTRRIPVTAGVHFDTKCRNQKDRLNINYKIGYYTIEQYKRIKISALFSGVISLCDSPIISYPTMNFFTVAERNNGG